MRLSSETNHPLIGKGVQLGTIDLAFTTGAPLPNFVPDVGLFNIPFLFHDLAHAHAVLDGSIGQSYLEKFREKDLVALAWGENGMLHITNSKHEIRSPENLNQLCRPVASSMEWSSGDYMRHDPAPAVLLGS
jgi:TRAP-type C4-dicarboxylate transport system substrate-binding protein